MAPRTLLAVIDTTQVSGPGRQLTALLGVLRQGGTDARVLTFHRAGRPSSPFVAFLESAGIPCIVVPERSRFDFSLVRRVRSALREFRPEVVQTHSYKATAVVWLLRQTGERFGWVGCFHGATTENLAVRLYHRLDLWLLRGADHMVLMAEAQRALFGRHRGSTVVINNAVLHPTNTEPSPPAGGPNATFGYVGRLSPEKGVDLLLDAVAILAREAPAEDWSLLVAGDGPERTSLERQATQLGLNARVTFLGQVADPWTVYGRVACVVLPSRSEGLPNVLLEAIAADRAVVATAVGAVPSVLGHGAAGVLVPPANVKRLAQGMREALHEPMSTRGSWARARIEVEFSLNRRVEHFIKLYESLLRGKDRQIAQVD